MIVSTFCVPATALNGLNTTVGLPGPAAFALSVDAEWILESSGGTTTTTTAGGGTTSTSLPSSCTGAAECDDGNPCTTDDCPTGTCVNTPQAGAAGAGCQLGDFLASPPCTLDAKLDTAATTLLGQAQAAVQSLSTAAGKAVVKAKAKADKALKKLGKKVRKAAKKAGRVTPPGCEATFAAEITRLRALVATL